jgi:hypothetical protein
MRGWKTVGSVAMTLGLVALAWYFFLNHQKNP